MKLNRLDSIIIYTKHLTIKETQTILEEKYHMKRSVGFISQARNRLQEQSLEILFEEAKHFPDKHLTRLSTLRYLLEESFINLKKEEEPLKKQHIIDSIVQLQYHIAGFDEATKGIIEKHEGSTQGLPISEKENISTTL